MDYLWSWMKCADLVRRSTMTQIVSCPFDVLEGSLFFWQWEHPPLAVGTYTASGNFLLAVGMPCVFYSQHHTLIWRNKTDLEEQSLDDLFNSLKIYEAEVKSSSSASTSTQNIVFVSFSNTDITNEPVSDAASVSDRTGRNLGANGPTSIGFDMSKVECYNCHRKGYFAMECRSPKDTRRNSAAEPQRRNVPVETFTSNALVSQCDESVEARLLVYQQNETVFEEDIKLLKLEVQLRDNALVVLRQNLEKAEQERDDMKLKLEKFQTSSKNLRKMGMETYMPNLRPCFLQYKCINDPQKGNPQHALKDKRVIDSGCSRHMTGNMSYLSDFEELNGGYVAFGGNPKGGKIFGKGKIRTRKLDFDDVYFVKELKFNLFIVSQMCDKKNIVLFTNTECLVLSPEFKLPDENQVLLRVPWENNMYNVDLKNIVPSGDLTCLFAKVTLDKSNLWHKRLGYINFKTMNKLVKGNLVRGLPTKFFKNNHTCVACKKGKQHKASCKTKPVSSVNQPLQRLHMDLFGPTFVKSLNKKSYCLVVTDDYSRFTWVFFLATKDETRPILKTFITGIENQLSLKVKVIKSDNGTELKNNDLNQFCGLKGIKREFSVPRTPQQNGIAERKNRTLIEATRTMLADSLLPIPFWAKAVNTACYVQNRVLVTKPQNKTPYELLLNRTPSI
nr:putative ribonuclease H-like domain-containing protein [Tanacetum cinerariifolium]